MKNKLVWALAVVNIALAVSLMWRGSSDNTARAQAARRSSPTDVIMIPGALPSGSSSVIYLVDVGNHQLSAMSYNGQGVDFLSPPLDLDRIFERAGTAVGTGGAGGTGSGTGTGTGTTGGRGTPRAR
ncbi:MAG TPA: hypothetical protein VF669_14115 [Tepidisphaeraceae bacterium]|jgi:hypothetical protein